MWLGLTRQKAVMAENGDLSGLKARLDRAWNLSDPGFVETLGFGRGAGQVVTQVFYRLNISMTGILKGVVALASLGPELFRISRDFKEKARTQKDKACDIARADRRISQGIENISSGTRELTQEFGKIETNVTCALEKGDQSMAGFNEIKSQVAVLVETIRILKEKSDSIGAIIDVLNTISDETDILSLNARIAAARGQEDGRGFKVIAEEVGNLARQSKDATRQIQTQLTGLGQTISRTVAAVDQVEENVSACEGQITEANGALNQVCRQFGSLSGNLSRIDEAAGRQAEDVKEASAGIEEIESALEAQVRDADAIFHIAGKVNEACDQMILNAGSFHLESHRRAGLAGQKMALDPAIFRDSRENREKALERYLGEFPFIELAYITDASGRQITYNVYARNLKGQEGLETGLNRNWAEKEWFREPVRSGKTFISEVYRSSATQTFCFTVSVPLRDRDALSGVLGIDINVRDMLNI